MNGWHGRQEKVKAIRATYDSSNLVVPYFSVQDLYQRRRYLETMSNIVKVAVTQHEPVWFDLQATVDKTCRLMEEAAANGAQLIAFPEVWITGYPAWIW